MLLRKLLDPDETARRRRLRARIVRRNRIRKEIAQGLEPKWHRRTPATARTVHDYGWNPLEDGTAAVADQRRVENEGSALAFLVRAATPTDGSRSKAVAARARSPALMEGVEHVPSRFRNRAAMTEDQRHGASAGSSGDAGTANHRPVATASGEDIGGNGVARPFNDRVRMQWKDVLERILIQRHEQILAKDANRAWRQERLALLLFKRKQYAAAREHFVKAITLGSKSSLCWRRLAQCHWFDYVARHDWDALWDAKAAFEQALCHVEMACNPYVLLDYARVLEVLGSYEAALTACASLLTTFPRFALRTAVTVRFVVLQRYQLLTSGETMKAVDKERAIGKCLELTKTLLLDKNVVDSAQYPLVLYTHVRLNELLFETAITRSDASGTAVAKAAKTSADVSAEELFKLAGSLGIGSITPNMNWKTWRLHSDTYLRWADHFQRMDENIAAADALARALELMEIPLEKQQPLKTPADENASRKIALYTAMAFNYYQSNQMERAIRAMETIFQLDPFIETVRQSLATWFPAKWKDRIELEDASQVQIARVLRGLWGRAKAQERRREVERQLEITYRAHPYHPLHRRNLLRLLKAQYAPLFLAQDLAARRIQLAARKFLAHARIRWAFQAQKAKQIRDLRTKHGTRKYRYNRHVRFQLAQLVPDEFDARFRREDQAAAMAQRWYRGERVRKAYRAERAAIRVQIEREIQAVGRIQRAYRTYRQHSERLVLVRADQLLYETQRRLQHARERLAVQLQRLYRHWKNRLVLATRIQLQQIARHRRFEVRSSSAAKIQRRWRRHAAHRRGDKTSDASMLLDELRRGRERVLAEEAEAYRIQWEGSARKIQAAYRGNRVRASLVKITRQVAPPATSEIALLQQQAAKDPNQVSRVVILTALDSVKQKRALFDFPVVVLRPDALLPLDHVTAAIQHSSVLHTLVLDGGNFQSPRAETIFQSLRFSKTLRVVALGNVRLNASRYQGRRRSGTPTVPEDNEGDVDDSEDDSTSEDDDDFEVDDGQDATPMRVLYETLRTANFLLEQLLLDGNDLLVRRDARWLAQVVGDYFYGRYGKLKVLAAQRMQISDDAAATFGNALAINTVLERLNLSGNFIRDAAALAIATNGLSFNASLVHLNLADNCVGSSGARALFASLETANRTLRSLILSNNLVMNDAVAGLFTMLQANAVVEEMDLRGNLIHADHLSEIDDALRERTTACNGDLRLFLARRRLSRFTQHGGRVTTMSSAKRTCVNSKRQLAPLSPQKWIQAHTQPTTGRVGASAPLSLVQPPCVVFREVAQYASSKKMETKPHKQTAVGDTLLFSSPPRKQQKPQHELAAETRLPVLVVSPPRGSQLRRGRRY